VGRGEEAADFYEPPLSGSLPARASRGERDRQRAPKCRRRQPTPKGYAALSRSTFLKPPALPEVADSVAKGKGKSDYDDEDKGEFTGQGGLKADSHVPGGNARANQTIGPALSRPDPREKVGKR
jgi:hypothetical protein